MLPLLKVVMGFLNPGQVGDPVPPTHELPLISTNLFRLVASTQEATKGLFKVELYLFCMFHVENANGLDLLIWWFVNELKFPNGGFLAQQIFDILGPQIKIKQIFLVVGMFISSQQCHIGVENLDMFIMIYNNWPIHALMDCKLVDGDKLAKVFVVEILLEENEDLLEKASYFEEIESNV